MISPILITSESLFDIDRVLMDGLFAMAGDLYGLRFTERTDLSLLHADQRAFEVMHKDGRYLGLIIFDLIRRHSKSDSEKIHILSEHSTEFEYSSRTVLIQQNRVRRLRSGQISLMSFDEVS